eukprot:TRINITY_DN16834_c0_g2_i1.p1 TRINITY_DN16834_c0_g2~~TRINITY_DN16834_c0_g2_i1.p1  ORF type:complete len:322 (+),score=55.55 TRINITY_DN16834_c0_g2_i1:87-968(+)
MSASDAHGFLPKLTTNDVVLTVSLCYLCADIIQEWQEFAGCRKPVNLWLLVSYAMIVVSRIIYVVGSTLQNNEQGDFLLNLRHKGASSRLNTMMWLFLAPAFALWTLLGSCWLITNQRETPKCLPNSVHLWILFLWQILSYCWIIIHAGLGITAWALELRVRRTEAALQQIEDEDTRNRWGSVSDLPAYPSLQGIEISGLAPETILELPLTTVASGTDMECSICLSSMEVGEAARQLPACGHLFHRSCIDLWLLRTADCPLCKEKVQAGGAWGTPAPAAEAGSRPARVGPMIL